MNHELFSGLNDIIVEDSSIGIKTCWEKCFQILTFCLKREGRDNIALHAALSRKQQCINEANHRWINLTLHWFGAIFCVKNWKCGPSAVELLICESSNIKILHLVNRSVAWDKSYVLAEHTLQQFPSITFTQGNVRQ